MPDRSLPCTFVVGLALLIPTARAEDAKPARVDFDRQVRPILSNHCFPALAPATETAEAGLRFDVQATATKPNGRWASPRPSRASRRRKPARPADLLEAQGRR